MDRLSPYPRTAALHLLLPLALLVGPANLAGDPNSGEFCFLDTYKAECSNRDEVIFMDRARFGRMKKGICVKRDYGSIGCGADVLAEMDRKCSGRHQCSFTVSDLHASNECSDELTPFLEAEYSCLPVTLPDERAICSSGQPALTVTSHEGYLANIFAEEDEGGFGSESCPWRIQALPGQQINISVVNFALVPEPLPKSETEAEPENPYVSVHKLCYKLATLRVRTHAWWAIQVVNK